MVSEAKQVSLDFYYNYNYKYNFLLKGALMNQIFFINPVVLISFKKYCKENKISMSGFVTQLIAKILIEKNILYKHTLESGKEVFRLTSKETCTADLEDF